MSRQFLRFLLTGGIAALVNLGCRYLLNLVMPFWLAVPIAYLFGMITAYVLARVYVFDESGRSRASEFRRFAVVNGFALFIVWGVSLALAKVLFPWVGLTWHADDIAHFIGVLSPVAISYVGHRHYTFSKKAVAASD
ncbi:GtrA family protein [Granulibacter bethesdensis]|uniref:GtrA family protein n=1 Tax=Granulibacter bethesdensis TaxID=364410 RepID=UPI0003F1F4E1|nr:GtrA family protein [Granulibacter bethesdensis]AHJ65232.1 putative membrane spanning protein [Granulibacter bethesdensis CGDNIH4]